jgi:hypothetical protein
MGRRVVCLDGTTGTSTPFGDPQQCTIGSRVIQQAAAASTAVLASPHWWPVPDRGARPPTSAGGTCNQRGTTGFLNVRSALRTGGDHLLPQHQRPDRQAICGAERQYSQAPALCARPGPADMRRDPGHSQFDHGSSWALTSTNCHNPTQLPDDQQGSNKGNSHTPTRYHPPTPLLLPLPRAQGEARCGSGWLNRERKDADRCTRTNYMGS